MAAFGFAIGDFLAVSALAYDLYRLSAVAYGARFTGWHGDITSTERVLGPAIGDCFLDPDVEAAAKSERLEPVTSWLEPSLKVLHDTEQMEPSILKKWESWSPFSGSNRHIEQNSGVLEAATASGFDDRFENDIKRHETLLKDIVEELKKLCGVLPSLQELSLFEEKAIFSSYKDLEQALSAASHALDTFMLSPAWGVYQIDREDHIHTTKSSNKPPIETRNRHARVMESKIEAVFQRFRFHIGQMKTTTVELPVDDHTVNYRQMESVLDKLEERLADQQNLLVEAANQYSHIRKPCFEQAEYDHLIRPPSILSAFDVSCLLFSKTVGIAVQWLYLSSLHLPGLGHFNKSILREDPVPAYFVGTSAERRNSLILTCVSSSLTIGALLIVGAKTPKLARSFWSLLALGTGSMAWRYVRGSIWAYFLIVVPFMGSVSLSLASLWEDNFAYRRWKRTRADSQSDFMAGDKEKKMFGRDVVSPEV